MACMGLRLAQRANGVSKLHGAVSREMFAGLWPGFDADEVPIGSVTNGVHAPTWVSREVMELAAGRSVDHRARRFDAVVRPTRRSGAPGGPARAAGGGGAAPAAGVVAAARRRAAELGWIDNVFDPDILTIGFARRVPSYKRLTLMLRDRARLTRSCCTIGAARSRSSSPASPTPPTTSASSWSSRWCSSPTPPQVRHRMAYLPDYDMGMARYLYSGCDVWLNNPLRPLEACGTSGMKAALNGALNLSIRDGWWDEMYDGQNGWAIPTADGVGDPNRRDDLEAAALYELLDSSRHAAFYEQARAAARPLGGDGQARSSRWARRCWRVGWCATTSRSSTRPPHGRRQV